MRRFLILPLLLAAVAFAACGDDSTEDTAAAPNETATEAPTETATAEATPAAGDSGVEVTGELGEAPEVEVPEGQDPPSELVIEDIVEGTGEPAATGQTVNVQYYGALYKDGTKFDASWDRGQAFSFSLGSGQVIPGWDEGLVGMKQGGRRLLVIPPELAYGETGTGPIGPNETLVFVVDMESITAP